MLKFALGMSKPAREQVAAGLEIYRRLEDGVGIAMSTGMLGLVDRFLGNDEAALAETEQALQFAREAGTEQGIIMALNTRARMAAEIEHDPIKARALIDEAISRARSSGNRWFLGLPLYARGMLAFAGNDYATATRSLEESMQVFREEEDDYFCSVSRSGLAETARLRGDLERAARLHLDTLNEWNHIGHLGGLARALETLAFIARAQAERMDGDVNAALERRRRAARLFGAAESLRRQNGSVMMREERAEYEEEVASLKAKMGSAELDEEWARGAEMSQAEAVAYARAG